MCRGVINVCFGIREHRLEWYMREFEWRYNTSDAFSGRFSDICWS